VMTTRAISRAKLQSNPHHQQTNTELFTGRMPFTSLNQQCQSTEGKISHSTGLLTPSSPGSLLFKLCLWPLKAPGYLGEGCHASHQPSDASARPSDCLCDVNTASAAVWWGDVTFVARWPLRLRVSASILRTAAVRRQMGSPRLLRRHDVPMTQRTSTRARLHG